MILRSTSHDPLTRGFTLVELLVVMSILVILGALGFIAIGGYSSTARDSHRIETFAQMQTGLELVFSKTGKYPMPDGAFLTGGINGTPLVYSGQIGENVARLIDYHGPLTDPSTNSFYSYGISALGKQYQIAGVTENSFAGNGYRAQVVGNYNGLLVKDDKVYNVPSLIFTGSTDLAAPSTYFVANDQENLPYAIGSQTNITPKATSDVLATVTSGATHTLTGQTIPRTMDEFLANSGSLNQLGYPLNSVGPLILGTQYTNIVILPSCLLGDGSSTGSVLSECSL